MFREVACAVVYNYPMHPHGVKKKLLGPFLIFHATTWNELCGHMVYSGAQSEIFDFYTFLSNLLPF